MQLQQYGCRIVGLGDQPRSGADAVLAAYLDALNKQRVGLARVQPRTGSLCGELPAARTSVVPVRLPQVLWGQLCVFESGVAKAKESALGQADVRLIAANLLEHTSAAELVSCAKAVRLNLRLVLTNEFGDPIVLTRDCTGRYLYRNGIGQPLEMWTPSASVAKRLAALAGG